MYICTYVKKVYKNWTLIFQNSIREEIKESKDIFLVSNNKKNIYLLKRFFDFIFSFILIVVISPLFLIIAFLIYLDSPGPIFFVQDRVGLNGKIFKMYKFRSMIVDAETLLEQIKPCNELEGPMFKIKNDPRITSIGKFIRKTSLDELPQIFNVLKGDMSFVGPRPPLIEEYSLYTEYELNRLAVLPGCSGIWQVCGRSNIKFDEMVKLDIWYIKNNGVILDFFIVLKTISHIIFPKKTHAY